MKCWESLVAGNAARAALMLPGCVSRDAEDVPAMLGSPSVRHDGAQHGAAGKRRPASLEHDLNPQQRSSVPTNCWRSSQSLRFDVVKGSRVHTTLRHCPPSCWARQHHCDAQEPRAANQVGLLASARTLPPADATARHSCKRVCGISLWLCTPYLALPLQDEQQHSGTAALRCCQPCFPRGEGPGGGRRWRRPGAY